MTWEAWTILALLVVVLVLYIWHHVVVTKFEARLRDSRYKQASMEAQLAREKEKQNALEGSLDHAHARLNELVRERKKADTN